MRTVGALVAVAMIAPSVLAQPASDADAAATLRAQAEDHARRGEYAQAIEKFKAADRSEPRAQHACMIGLAYLRRSMWAQAELFIARCKTRSASGEALPEWLPDAERQLAEGLAAARVSAVKVVVVPPTAAATFRVSGFAADEEFDPQTLHLPEGAYTITVNVAQRAPIAREIRVPGTHETVELVVDLAAPPAPAWQTVPRSPWGTRLLVGAGIAALGGAVLHALALREQRALEDATTLAGYRDHETAFDVERGVSLGLYGVAAIAIGAGLYLRMRAPERRLVVTGAVTGDGAAIAVSWQR